MNFDHRFWWAYTCHTGGVWHGDLLSAYCAGYCLDCHTEQALTA